MKALAVLFALVLFQATSARAAVDVGPLLGGWEWVSSTGGLLGARETPPPSGWTRVLYFHRDGTFAFWEVDSAASYLLKSGNYVAHEAGERDYIEDGQKATYWLEMPGWSGMAMGHELVAFVDENTILNYPGGGGLGVSDALKNRYRRDRLHPEPTPSQSAPPSNRPPRIRNGFQGGHWIELSQRFEALRSRIKPFVQWNDYAYPRSLLDSYAYANDQVPSAVIGDLDGDSVLDVALQGRASADGPGGVDTSKVVCFLSNRGSPQVTTLLREPTWSEEGRSMETRAYQRPPSCLMLYPAGSPILDGEGERITLSTPAVLVARPSKDRTVYYYLNGGMRQGWPTAADRVSIDSVALIGAWRWTHSRGGLQDATIRPPRGTERILLFRADGTYSVWQHAAAVDSICYSGSFTVHRHLPTSDTRGSSFWIELPGWNRLEGGRQLVTFAGRDKIRLYPGGGNLGVMDALTHFYERAKNWREPAR